MHVKARWKEGIDGERSRQWPLIIFLFFFLCIELFFQSYLFSQRSSSRSRGCFSAVFLNQIQMISLLSLHRSLCCKYYGMDTRPTYIQYQLAAVEDEESAHICSDFPVGLRSKCGRAVECVKVRFSWMFLKLTWEYICASHKFQSQLDPTW